MPELESLMFNTAHFLFCSRSYGRQMIDWLIGRSSMKYCKIKSWKLKIASFKKIFHCQSWNPLVLSPFSHSMCRFQGDRLCSSVIVENPDHHYIFSCKLQWCEVFIWVWITKAFCNHEFTHVLLVWNIKSVHILSCY